MKLKVGIISSICNSHSGARAPIELAVSLAKRKHQATIFTSDRDIDQKTLDYLQKHNVKVVFIPHPSPFILGNIKAAWIIRKEIIKINPDVLTSHTYPTFHLGGFLSGKPIVMTYHGSQFNGVIELIPPDETPSYKLRLANFIANIYTYFRMTVMSYTSKKMITISKFTQEELKRMYGKDSSIIYWSAIPHFFKEEKADSSIYKKGENEIVFLSISRLIRYKGFHHLIQAFKNAKLKNTSLIIAGSAPNPRYLSYLKQISNSKVKISVNISDNQLLHLYQIADIYITCDRYLFFGLPLLEAAYFDIPAIAMDYCAAQEIVLNGKTGFVVNSIPEFTNMLKLLSENEKLRKMLSLQTKRRAKQDFDWLPMITKYEKLFSEIIGN